MTAAANLLKEYHSSSYEDVRHAAAFKLLRLAPFNHEALSAVLFILNDANDSRMRLRIVQYLKYSKPPEAIAVLAKEMFDPDPVIRANAASGLADYEDAALLAPVLSAFLNALPDPATRSPAERAILSITGRGADKLTVSEKERVRLGESAESIWPDRFGRSTTPPSIK